MDKQNFWETDKGNSLIKMGLWLIFIVFLIIVFAFKENESANTIQENNPNEVEEQGKQEEVLTFKTYFEMQSNLQFGSYEYIYEITGTDFKYIYTGSVCNNKNLGFKESEDEVIKYLIKDNKYYQVNLDTLEEIDNLYENINSSFLDINMLFNNLKSTLYGIEKNGNVRTITYNKGEYLVSVDTDLENITDIKIVSDGINYNFHFANIGYCAKIDFE